MILEVEVTFRPEVDHSIMVMICFVCLPVILCQVGGRPIVWHELKHCKTEREGELSSIFYMHQTCLRPRADNL